MDIDIDFANRDDILKLIDHTPAMIKDKGVRKHLTGIYVQTIPNDPINGLCTLDYREAQTRGYFKLDFLNMSVYQSVKDPQHYQWLLEQTPPWHRLWEDAAWASQLVHVGNYTSLLQHMRPDSIPRMAAFISVIRPGKAHLQNKPWAEVMQSVWDGDDSQGFVFKKAHAISYSMLVTLHMNILNQHLM